MLRGKYMSTPKFLSSLEKGFGFCDVVLGWDKRVEALCSGELDEVPEQAFFNVGGVESVLEKARTLQES